MDMNMDFFVHVREISHVIEPVFLNILKKDLKDVYFLKEKCKSLEKQLKIEWKI